MSPRRVCWFSSRAVLLAGLLGVAFALVGCTSGGEAHDSVTGKVTLDGQPVAGEVVFVSGDKQVGSPIGQDGSYSVKNPPKGEVQILVKQLPGPPKNIMPAKDAPEFKTPSGATPPAKYAQFNNGLTLTVTGGKQKH